MRALVSSPSWVSLAFLRCCKGDKPGMNQENQKGKDVDHSDCWFKDPLWERFLPSAFGLVALGVMGYYRQHKVLVTLKTLVAGWRNGLAVKGEAHNQNVKTHVAKYHKTINLLNWLN